MVLLVQRSARAEGTAITVSLDTTTAPIDALEEVEERIMRSLQSPSGG